MKEAVLFFSLLALPAMGANPALPSRTAGRNAVIIRGQIQDVYYYPAKSPAVSLNPVLFLGGDAGVRGFAVDLAQSMSEWGYDVYSLDTKRYLESFTGKTTLKEADVMNDFGQMAAWIDPARARRISLVGWSEGAGLCLLGAAPPQNKELFSGVVTLGLPGQSALGWRFADDLTWITKAPPKEPAFRSAEYMPKVAPLRLWMLQSTKDEYVPLETSRALFAAAREPKKFSAIEANNHRFEGNQKELFRLLAEGLRWMN